MIRLGSITLTHSDSIYAIRKKVLQVLKLFTEDPILPGKIASATSQVCRLLDQTSVKSTVNITLFHKAHRLAFCLTFVGQHPLPEAAFLHIFFDEVNYPTSKRRVFQVQCVVFLKTGLPHDGLLEQARRILAEKSRYELMQELERKNKKLLKSLENLRRETLLKEQLTKDNMRMAAELDLLKRMQQLILPKPEELESIKDLDIAGFMQPADEVGGDYYDVLCSDGVITIAIGDVTGHGLESGILMVMTQTAVRTLQEIKEQNPVRFLDTLNRAIYNNIERMQSDKNITLAILNYANGKISISGQHEETIVVRKGGKVERIDTIDLGFPIGLHDDIREFINHHFVELEPGDGIVLYTDGITEAENLEQEHYGIERLCALVSRYWHQSSEEIKSKIIEDVYDHIGQQKVFDDITLLVVKKR
ncbi:PP2C family protein-serine/threonine phosphatase [Spirulina subsalsa FACHB-351]|uniref:PP2C family protein-serine/threonine phosphatase n=1 Tax=Spirulina subsalsa FACHB-351 TaxID=234711 RepID=A0ABT3L662_9CYAN|nr:PP2C family protein-serine/threonine phosphatase [Spirulina subsalsa]MCW6036988.1 PP2C family protein-serine/threonine phosphatase [Spirulina subsalsa FACHB-351]